jgi:hypothetical protein
VRSPAIPLDGVVREGDGTMIAWATADRRRFTKRTLKLGLQRGGYVQIVEGVKVGEDVATESALTVMWVAPPAVAISGNGRRIGGFTSSGDRRLDTDLAGRGSARPIVGSNRPVALLVALARPQHDRQGDRSRK